MGKRPLVAVRRRCVDEELSGNVVEGRLCGDAVDDVAALVLIYSH
jgi:hypothetical protein